MTNFKRTSKFQASALTPLSSADAILCADLHIRPDTPICRTDDFFAAMEKKIDFILGLSINHNCPILVAGDLGTWPLNNGWPTWLLEWFIKKVGFNRQFICIPGQHDLPNHKLDLFEKSGMGVLNAAKAIQTIGLNDSTYTTAKKHIFEIVPFPYSKEIKTIYKNPLPLPRLIAMTHQMIIEDKKLWPDQNAPKGHQILKKFPEYQLILSGDNHNAFVAEYEGRKLVNPGSMMRTTADQENHRPRVYLWHAKTNEIEAVYLPIEQGVISRTHIEVAQDRTKRNQAFIERVNSDIEIKLSYENNLENYFKKYRTEKKITEKVWDSIEK